MQRGRREDAAREALKPGVGQPQAFAVATGVKVVIDLPAGAIDPSFIPEAVDDMKAAYERALERSWQRFDALVGRGQRLKARAVRS